MKRPWYFWVATILAIPFVYGFYFLTYSVIAFLPAYMTAAILVEFFKWEFPVTFMTLMILGFIILLIAQGVGLWFEHLEFIKRSERFIEKIREETCNS